MSIIHVVTIVILCVRTLYCYVAFLYILFTRRAGHK